MKKIVSIIIPCKNSGATLERCLLSLKGQTYKNIEILVIDNNSTDDTKKIAKKYTKFIYNFGPERSAQRNYGAKRARGDYLLFIDSDMELERNVVKEAVIQMTHEEILGVIIPERSFGEGIWSDCKTLERSFYLNLDWMEAPRFFRKNIFITFDGYDEENTGTEDYDLPQRMKLNNGKEIFSRTTSFINHNEGNLNLLATLKKKFYYAQKIDKYKKRNQEYLSKQVSIFKRFLIFFNDPIKLFKRPLVGLAMLLMKALEFLAGGLGYIKSKL